MAGRFNAVRRLRTNPPRLCFLQCDEGEIIPMNIHLTDWPISSGQKERVFLFSVCQVYNWQKPNYDTTTFCP